MSLNDFYKFLEDKEIEYYIVKLRYKYSWEPYWNYSNEILEWEPELKVYEWCYDWNEGYDDIEVLGYIAIADVNVPDNLKEE